MNILKVLLIEDNPDHARLIRRLLKTIQPSVSSPPQFELHHSDRVERALIFLNTIRFDIILLDLFLPDSSHLETFERIHKAAPNIPIVIISGYNDESVAMQAMQHGAQDFLSKDDSLEPAILTRTIRHAIERNRLRKQLEEKTRVLAATETSRRAIIEQNPDGIIIVNKAGFVRFVNPAAENILQSNAEDLLDQSFSLPMSRDGTAELTVRRKSGNKTAVELRLVETEWEGEQVNLISLRDITVHQEAKAQMRQRTDELISQNIALDEFAHTMAHQVQGLLSQMIGYASYIEMHHQTKADDDMNLAIDRIIQSGHKMNNVISELLLLASIRSDEIPIIPVDLNRVASEVKKRLRFQIEENEAVLLEPAHWPMVMGHAPWIEEALLNYISNGIKYGGVPPTLELGSNSQDDGMICIWVKDNGQGIPEADRARLFKPHTRLQQRRVRGEGLGLSIVNRIIRRCGGEVGLTSKLGEGSKFWFTLPQINTPTNQI